MNSCNIRQYTSIQQFIGCQYIASGGWKDTNENISNDGEGFGAGGGENNHLGHSGVVILTLSVQEIDSINAVITMKEVWALNEFGTESDQNFYLLY